MSQVGSLSKQSQSTAASRLYIDTPLTTYTLTNAEIIQNPVVYFSSPTSRTVNLNFPDTFNPGFGVDAYQGFEPGLGNIIVSAPWKDPTIDTYGNADHLSFFTITGNIVMINALKQPLVAFAAVSPALFSDTQAGELPNYINRYRMRIFNTVGTSIEIGLDAIDIELGWSGVSQYLTEFVTQQYIPKAADSFVLQTTSWASTGGQAPQGGKLTFDFTRQSDDVKTSDVTDNANGNMTFNLLKKPLVTLL